MPFSRVSALFRRADSLGCGLLLAACLSACLSAVLSACIFEDRGMACSACGGARPIVPLAVGNAWAYVDSAYYGDNGAGGDSIIVDSTHVRVTGTRLVTLGGAQRTVYLWNTRDRGTGQPGALTLWLQNRADGNHTVGAEQDTASFVFAALHVKHPAAAGDRYPIYFLSFREENGLVPAIDTLEAEVVHTGLTCTVPAGTFPCVQYRGWRPDSILHATTWYAPGVGYLGSEVVRTLEVNGEARTVTFRKKLASYTLY